LTALVAVAFAVRHLNILFLKLGWILIFPAVAAVRSLFVRIPSPSGVPLDAKEAPQLFALLERIRNDLDAPRPSAVLVDDDLNASIVQEPRFGIFGGARSYVVIGLPLAQALSPAQLEAVLAHEFGHLTRNHGRIATAVFSLYRLWQHLLAAMEQHANWLLAVMIPFYRWYLPRFENYSSGLTRRVEEEADRLAAERVGSLEAARALVAIDVQAQRLARDFWPGIWRRVNAEPEPPALYAAMVAELRTPVPGAEDLVSVALTRATERGDTHPALRDRLMALGVCAEDAVSELESAAIGPSAAQVYLGDVLAQLERTFDASWSEAARSSWRESHAEAHARTEELERLEKSATEGTLSADDARKQAMLAALARREDAIGLLTATAQRSPDDAAIHFHLGRLLVEERRDGAGIAHLERAMELERMVTPAAAYVAATYLSRAGESNEAWAYRRRIEDHTPVAR
jgi:Zn-dependent protease with chaperone function